MPAYSFKERFVEPVEKKKKRQTIRAKRKHRPRVGQTASLFYGLRTKHTRKLGEYMIRDVKDITITPSGAVAIGVTLQSTEQKEQLAIDDGFVDFADFMSFWKKEHFSKPGNEQAFEGDIIYW